MSININCKKKWHPSRYETRKQVEEVKQKLLKENEEVNKKNDETRRLILENKLESDDNRMDWML
ncbi:hypothetical protein NBO_15g0019 [Nosema bombycis CQ1]|jgi:cell division protein FtsL|uniref:CBF1-interacting co-repressor CIR N-terminal domain-containing protein n=1 Tax=Nosema bombycis (strain CQ1 / CVCC 102059) TaxID=578461 RepID=R0KX62_NOSB1|nr:hypothetical protein NBO_15g0019 [Nosema bombycis CQ1]|eukprot:EOB14807.1 hypothetical protein NBO_15g0019 [Nosema bombycis CQ1]